MMNICVHLWQVNPFIQLMPAKFTETLLAGCMSRGVPDITWEGKHTLRIDLQHVRQQLEVGHRQRWELQEVHSHQRNDNVQAHKHHLHSARMAGW